VLLRVPQLRTLPLYSEGLRCYHVSRDSGPYLPTKADTGAAMCPSAPDPASQLRRDPTLPCVPRLQILPPYSGGLRRCYVSPNKIITIT
jgi:hypothetical protein